jgi:hypothetical protein
MHFPGQQTLVETIRELATVLVETPLLPYTVIAVLAGYSQTWCVPPVPDSVVERLIEEARARFTSF